ncbi:hypothetical protein ABT065_34755, partial [Streptomyces sp. NPDC002764]|uniref:hypothetical protein n=1 Tax=Streptomyces sp. NPDC002764 TaxID=3154428 RepID=UPI00331850FA
DVPQAGKKDDHLNDMAWLRQLLDWQKRRRPGTAETDGTPPAGHGRDRPHVAGRAPPHRSARLRTATAETDRTPPYGHRRPAPYTTARPRSGSLRHRAREDLAVLLAKTWPLPRWHNR